MFQKDRLDVEEFVASSWMKPSLLLLWRIPICCLLWTALLADILYNSPNIKQWSFYLTHLTLLSLTFYMSIAVVCSLVYVSHSSRYVRFARYFTVFRVLIWSILYPSLCVFCLLVPLFYWIVLRTNETLTGIALFCEIMMHGAIAPIILMEVFLMRMQMTWMNGFWLAFISLLYNIWMCLGAFAFRNGAQLWWVYDCFDWSIQPVLATKYSAIVLVVTIFFYASLVVLHQYKNRRFHCLKRLDFIS